MATYKIQKDSPKTFGGKTSLVVTFTDEVNGKADCTCYHEIESIDDTKIQEELEKAALEYEVREEKVSTVSKLETDKVINVLNVK
jgi:hypothetical protein